MSRSRKGSKGPGYDYWTRRPGNESGCQGYGPDVKNLTHRLERIQDKQIVEEQLKEDEEET